MEKHTHSTKNSTKRPDFKEMESESSLIRVTIKVRTNPAQLLMKSNG